GGDGQQNPYKGELVFQFAKGDLKVENISKIEDTIALVFQQGGGGNDQQSQNGQNQGQQGGPQDQGQGQQQDQASNCNPEINQTMDQVVQACGDPASKAKGAGTKLIYSYTQPKLKIIFVNGKVSDIE